MTANELQRPDRCASCDSADTEPHCPSPYSTWIRCQCRAITGIVNGN